MAPLFRIATRNVLRNWRHSLATIAAVAVGFFAFSIFEGYIADLRDQYASGISSRQMLGDILLEKMPADVNATQDVSEVRFDLVEQEGVARLLREEDGSVELSVRFLPVQGIASNGQAEAIFYGYGYDVAEGERLRAPWIDDTTAGQSLTVGMTDGLLAGQGLGLGLGCQVEASKQLRCPTDLLQLSASTETGQVNAVDARLVGVVNAGLKSTDDRFVRLPLALAQQLLDTQTIGRYAVKLRDPAQAEGVAARIQTRARKDGIALRAMRWQDHPQFGETFRRSMALLGVFRTFVTTVVVTIAGMSIFNTMVKAVNERTREIGVLRSLGFRRRQILQLLLLEAATLAGVASACGLVLTYAVAIWFRHAGIAYRAGMLAEAIPLTVALDPSSWGIAASLLLGIAIVATYVPARRAAGMNTADALRHV